MSGFFNFLKNLFFLATILKATPLRIVKGIKMVRQFGAVDLVRCNS